MLSDIPFLESVYQMLMLHKLKQLFFHQTAHIHRPHKTECHLSTQFCTSNLTLATVLSPSWHNLPRKWSKSRKVTKTPHPVRAMASAKMKEAKRHTWEKKRLCWSMDYFRERVLGKKHHESTKSTELQKGQSGGGVPSHWETVLFIGLIADKLFCFVFLVVTLFQSTACHLGKPSASHSGSFTIASLGSSNVSRIQIWIFLAFTLPVTSCQVMLKHRQHTVRSLLEFEYKMCPHGLVSWTDCLKLVEFPWKILEVLRRTYLEELGH